MNPISVIITEENTILIVFGDETEGYELEVQQAAVLQEVLRKALLEIERRLDGKLH